VSSIFRSREISRVFQVQSAPQAWPKSQRGEDGPFHDRGIFGGISRLVQDKHAEKAAHSLSLGSQNMDGVNTPLTLTKTSLY
jgi:hypothetical protein